MNDANVLKMCSEKMNTMQAMLNEDKAVDIWIDVAATVSAYVLMNYRVNGAKGAEDSVTALSNLAQRIAEGTKIAEMVKPNAE